MTNKPRILDLFCGAGGSAKGLQRAGFYVVGVDHKPQPRYCGDEFHQADAGTFPLDGYEFIWASPPCQAYCYLSNLTRRARDHPRLIEPTRRRLLHAGVGYVIENVQGAPLHDPIMLCGSAFGLRVRRHRLFESNLALAEPDPRCEHKRQGRSVGVYGHQGSGSLRARVNGGPFIRAKDAADAGDAMGIDWMTWRELTQAVPPAYSEWIGRQITQLAMEEAVP